MFNKQGIRRCGCGNSIGRLIRIGSVARNGPRIKCNDCGMQYDADYNACIKLAKKGISYLSNKSFLEKAGATDKLARTEDDYSQKSMSLETIS